MNKERYELKVYDRPSKESYYVDDNETGQHLNIITLVEILNNGTNRIAELKAENERLKDINEQNDDYIAELDKELKRLNELGLEPWYIKKSIKENEQLKEENERLKDVALTNFANEQKASALMSDYYVKKLVLEQQLKEKDEEIERLNKKWAELWQIYSHLGVEAFGNEIQNQALKEIAKLQRKDNTKKLKQQLKTNTKQVCEKIREAINECDFVMKDGFYYIKQIELNDKIDQIESEEK